MSGAMTPRRGFFPALWRDSGRSVLEDVEHALTRMWDEGDEGWFSRRMPSLDVSETEASIEAKLDLPGVSADEIEIHLNGNVLTVSGEHKEDKEEKGKTYHRLERRTGSFSRSFALPCPVEEDEVAAEFQNGVLTVTMPKTDAAKTRKIQVKS